MQTRRSQDTLPVPQGMSPRDVYEFAKARADALRARMAGGAK